MAALDGVLTWFAWGMVFGAVLYCVRWLLWDGDDDVEEDEE